MTDIISEAWFRLNDRACTPTDAGEVCTAFDVWSHTCHEQSIQHLGYGVQVGDGSVITGNIWVELPFLQQWGDKRCFVTRWKLAFTDRELGQMSY